MAARMMILVVIMALGLGSMANEEGGGPMFGYKAGSPDGPEKWGKLSPKYKLCGDGKKQSPIDISTAAAIPVPTLDNLTRVYADSPATIHNDGHDITMSFPNTDEVGSITINYHDVPKKLTLRKIHWHSPSEHTINGERFPLELHLVHVAAADGDIAVISVLYRIGKADNLYDQMSKTLEKLKTVPEQEAGVVDLKSLQKRTGSYFRYVGSLTTPPCTENVIWNILGKVREISGEQLQLLTAPLPGKDNRPAQPLNQRKIYFYNPPNSTISFRPLINFPFPSHN